MIGLLLSPIAATNGSYRAISLVCIIRRRKQLQACRLTRLDGIRKTPEKCYEPLRGAGLLILKSRVSGVCKAHVQVLSIRAPMAIHRSPFYSSNTVKVTSGIYRGPQGECEGKVHANWRAAIHLLGDLLEVEVIRGSEGVSLDRRGMERRNEHPSNFDSRS